MESAIVRFISQSMVSETLRSSKVDTDFKYVYNL